MFTTRKLFDRFRGVGVLFFVRVISSIVVFVVGTDRPCTTGCRNINRFVTHAPSNGPVRGRGRMGETSAAAMTTTVPKWTHLCRFRGDGEPLFKNRFHKKSPFIYYVREAAKTVRQNERYAHAHFRTKMYRLTDNTNINEGFVGNVRTPLQNGMITYVADGGFGGTIFESMPVLLLRRNSSHGK